MNRPTKPTASARGAAAYGFTEDGRDELLYDWIRKPTPTPRNGGHAFRRQAAEPQDWNRKKEPTMTTQTPAPAQTNRDNAPSLTDELNELRARFDEIEKLAAQGQELLTGLAPRLAELTAMVADVETVLHKWKRES